MNPALAPQMIQLIAWFIALVELILGLYIWLLNVSHTQNRWVGIFLVINALNTFSLGLLATASDAAEAAWASSLMAAVAPAIGPWALFLSILMLKPAWLQDRRRVLGWMLHIIAVAPALLLAIDLTTATSLWYSRLDPNTYAGGIVSVMQFTQGSLSAPIHIINIWGAALLPLALILYVAVFDRKTAPLTVQLARVLLLIYSASTFVNIGASGRLPGGAGLLITSTLLVFAYSFTAFWQMRVEHRLHSGALQARLTALVLCAALPLMAAVTAFVGNRAEALISQNAGEQLALVNRAMASQASTWLDLNSQALQTLVSLPDIISMDANRQQALVTTMASNYPHMTLVSTIDLDGLNVVRSDGLPPQNFAQAPWQQAARNAQPGDPPTLAIISDEASGRPRLVAALPIWKADSIVGVAMFTSSVSDLNQQAQANRVGQSSQVFIVDAHDQMVAHSDPLTSSQLQDFSASPPVSALRTGKRGAFQFSDAQGLHWQAAIDMLDNGWGIVVQQQSGELYARLNNLRQTTWWGIGLGVALLASLVWLTIWQISQPIRNLTATANIIASGDLECRAVIESNDEIGQLAQTLNSMTEQLSMLINSLEERVSKRTHDLERRSTYLEAAAQVSHAAASILDQDHLVRQVVEVIRGRFNLYYVGMFTVDTSGQWAVLRAGSGEAGPKMLARGHKIKVGQGMIGWSIANARARIALKASEDAVRLIIPELPDTYSEAALPLRSRGKIIGALSVQSNQPGAFDETTITILQVMADQVAVALDNARLFAESQVALAASRRAHGEMGKQSWVDLLHARLNWGYRYVERAIQPVEDEWPPDMEQVAQSGHLINPQENPEGLVLPLKTRDQVIGAVRLRKRQAGQMWSDEEIALLETLLDQMGIALESARLYQDTQRRAAREQMTGEIAARMRQTLDMENVLKTAVQEIRRTLGMSRVSVRLAASAQQTATGPLPATGQAENPKNDDSTDPSLG